MPRKPRKPPKDFMTQGDVAKKARVKGYKVESKTLGAMAQKGLIPFAKKNPHTKGMMFPKEKFMEVLKVAKKSAVLPKGSFTKYGLVQEAKRRGLTMETADIDTHLKRIEAGKEPMPEGLATDLFHSKHRLILPKKFAQQLLKEAEIRKNLPLLMKQGKLIPISQLATELGLSERSLNPRKDLKKTRIGNGLYIEKAEAARFKKSYEKGKPAGLGPLVPATEKILRAWVREKLALERNQAKRKMIWKTIRKNRRLSPEKFTERIIPVLDMLMKEKNSKS